LNNVFTSPTYLEDLTGITELKKDFENSVVRMHFNICTTRVLITNVIFRYLNSMTLKTLKNWKKRKAMTSNHLILFK